MDKSKLAYTHTYGCRANVSDGEKINGMLAEMRYGFTNIQDEADLILFNTCAVRENAENKVFGNIGALIHQKRRNPDLIVIVCGCMVQQEHITEKLYKTFPFVDLIFGTHVLHKFPELLNEVIINKRRVTDISNTETITEDLPIRRESEFKADVPIMFGCDNFCSYCVVPYVRGRERSRKPNDIINEIQGLVKDNVKEVMLLGQNVNSFTPSFPELLKEIEAINGDFRITYMTSHPKDLSRNLIDVIANSEKISHHLHLPVQSGSNRILELMNRGYTVEQYESIINYARELTPLISITTDIIVGFPGETRTDFEETLSLIKKIRFDSAYTFIYSKREGTKAAELPDTVTSEEKSAWFREMLDVLAEIGDTAYERYVGKTLRVLCEGEGRTGQGQFTGKSREGVIVDFNSDNTDIIGKFVNVKIDKALKWAVLGRST
ncbi:MAG: tRNA (N6-isopentenyl adenosine(37)-C2)-methylthiotransferase MiaB [Oscillospiraceae bacterium]|nr:tRNA (N6-isopentenyl adenosine(37)-C2)-methylthiotransferase MiaB [Oscillospiraceae bacterium]